MARRTQPRARVRPRADEANPRIIRPVPFRVTPPASEAPRDPLLEHRHVVTSSWLRNVSGAKRITCWHAGSGEFESHPHRAPRRSFGRRLRKRRNHGQGTPRDRTLLHHEAIAASRQSIRGGGRPRAHERHGSQRHRRIHRVGSQGLPGEEDRPRLHESRSGRVRLGTQHERRRQHPPAQGSRNRAGTRPPESDRSTSTPSKAAS